MLLIDNREPKLSQENLVGNMGEDQEIYEGLLLTVLIASAEKVKAGLRYAAGREYQDYPPGVLELGVALDAIDMMVNSVLHFMEINTRSE